MFLNPSTNRFKRDPFYKYLVIDTYYIINYSDIYRYVMIYIEISQY